MSRYLLLLAFLGFGTVAQAIPLQLQHSGRLADSTGTPLDGEHVLHVVLYDAAGALVWSDAFTTDVQDGYFNLILGSNTPLTEAVFADDGLFLGLAVDDGAELPVRMPLSSVPFAIRAGDARSVTGGVVDASEIRINGATVIDAGGAFVGDPGDVATLASLSCGAAQVPVYDGLAWGCGDQAYLHSHDASEITSGTFSVARLPVGSSSDDVAAGDHVHSFGQITGQLAGTQLPTDFADRVDAAVIDGALDFAVGSTIGGVAIVTGTAYADADAVAAMGAKGNTNPLHHDRYTDGEAVTAMGAKGNMNTLNHDRFTSTEAVTAMGAKANTNTLNHDRFTSTDATAAMGVKGNTNALNHDRFTAAEAVAAVAAAPRAWTLVAHDHFSTGAAGWTNNGTTLCGASSRMLGGFNTFAAGAVSRNFTNLPAHTELRVVFDWNFIDSWDGEQAYFDVDTVRRWNVNWAGAGGSEANVCGGTWGDTLGYPVEVHIPHTASTVNLRFGSTLNQGPDDESWGVDNVRIYVR